MNVEGVNVTQQQITAGLDAMRGSFRLSHVAQAMVDAGLPSQGIGAASRAGRAADRLMQKVRKRGDIEHTGGGVWKSKEDAASA